MSRLRVPVSDRDHVRGPARASVTLVEYGDFECPYCGRAYWVLRSLEDRFRRDLRYVFRHFPLTEIHPQAMPAAEAAEAAAAQGTFWDMHAMLYENQSNLELDDLVGYASALDLDVDRFLTDLQTHRHVSRIREDFMGGVRSGVNGTPTLFINDVRYDGLPDEATLAQEIESAQKPARNARTLSPSAGTA